MKFRSWLYLLIIALWGHSLPAQADLSAPQEFRAIADILGGYFSNQKDLNEAIQTAQVKSRTEAGDEYSHAPLVLDGDEKAAVNIPSKNLIVVDESRWKGITQMKKKARLVLHEYFGLVAAKNKKIDDRNYALSDEMISGDLASFLFTVADFSKVSRTKQLGRAMAFQDQVRCEWYDGDKEMGPISLESAQTSPSCEAYLVLGHKLLGNHGSVWASVFTDDHQILNANGPILYDPHLTVVMAPHAHVKDSSAMLLEAKVKLSAEANFVVTLPVEDFSIHCRRVHDGSSR